MGSGTEKTGTETGETKRCIGCDELIRPAAKKCPHCHQLQAWYHTETFINWVLIPPVVILLVFVLWYFLSNVRLPAGKSDKIPYAGLVIENEKLTVTGTGNQATITCMGKLVNRSQRDVKNIFLEADFLDANGTVIDTLPVYPRLEVKEGVEVHFRARSSGAKPAESYARCKASVIYASP